MRPGHIVPFALCTVLYSGLSKAAAVDKPLEKRDIPSNWQYVGCSTDADQRALPAHSILSFSLTLEACIAECDAHGYTYAGAETGTECWCDNSINNGHQIVSNDDCNISCAGNGSQKCGGAWRLSLYKKSTTAATGKFVVAHHMVGNTFPYTKANWAEDIAQAASVGIDAFALNIGRDDWQAARIADAWSAASDFGPNFKLFFSFDMTSLFCGSSADGNVLRNYIQTYATRPNQLMVNNRALVSTFAGENCFFGTGSVNQGWQATVKDGLPAVQFMPSFFVDPQTFTNYPVMDGDFDWNGGWPMGNYDINFDMDNGHLAGLAKFGTAKTFMAAVSPWFFTHYGPETYNKNWIYRSDNWLYATRWEQVIAQRDRIDVAQVVTWNDYGESHYVGPIKGAQPNSEAWVNGFDHQGWLVLTTYYATAFKTGQYPAITKDRIVLWSRPHPAAANACCDGVARPNNWQWTGDFLWAFVLSTAPATVTITAGSNSQSFSVGAGVSKLQVPSTAGVMRGTMVRNGATVIDFQPSGFSYTNSPQTYNFNAFVAASP